MRWWKWTCLLVCLFVIHLARNNNQKDDNSTEIQYPSKNSAKLAGLWWVSHDYPSFQQKTHTFELRSKVLIYRYLQNTACMHACMHTPVVCMRQLWICVHAFTQFLCDYCDSDSVQVNTLHHHIAARTLTNKTGNEHTNCLALSELISCDTRNSALVIAWRHCLTGDVILLSSSRCIMAK